MQEINVLHMGCQGVTRVTHARTFHFKFMFGSHHQFSTKSKTAERRRRRINRTNDMVSRNYVKFTSYKFCDFLPHVHVIFHPALVFCGTNPGIQGLTRPNQITRRKDCSRVDDAAKFSFQQVSFVDLKSA